MDSYYEKNKDATNVYTEGRVASQRGQRITDCPYKRLDDPFRMHWRQGYTDEAGMPVWKRILWRIRLWLYIGKVW
jgi:hypothetical protein